MAGMIGSLFSQIEMAAFRKAVYSLSPQNYWLETVQLCSMIN